MADSVEACQPGDITVTKVPRGFLIGRAIREVGPGPWWTYVGIVEDRVTAVRRALALAAACGVRAWFHETGYRFRRIMAEEPTK